MEPPAAANGSLPRTPHENALDCRVGERGAVQVHEAFHPLRFLLGIAVVLGDLDGQPESSQPVKDLLHLHGVGGPAEVPLQPDPTHGSARIQQ